ncbi:MAG: histidine phosphatase family protein [Verrucomicrobia bacterium]|nr:histidine phosphatase family protein [Verrucomicrobiota bacterium]
MILTLMRHPPIDERAERCIGQTDVALSPAGWAALLPLAERACRLRPDRILCSDLQRCRLLGETIAARLGLAAEPNATWREVNFGTWENRTWSDIQATEPRVLGEWLADFDKVSPPGGESFQHLQARVLSAIKSQITEPQSESSTGVSPVVPEEGSMGVSPVDSNLNTGETPLTQSHPRPHYLVVTHAGVIRAAASAFSGVSLRNAFERAVPYGSLTSFSWDGGSWSPLRFAVDIEPLAQGRIT